MAIVLRVVISVRSFSGHTANQTGRKQGRHLVSGIIDITRAASRFNKRSLGDAGSLADAVGAPDALGELAVELLPFADGIYIKLAIGTEV